MAAGRSAVAAVVVGALVVASAMAQDDRATHSPSGADLSAIVTVTPGKAGTKQHPRGVTIRATSRITTERGLEPPIVTGIDLLLGDGISYNGDEYAKCSKQVLDRQGPHGCPTESIVGSLIANARAGAFDTRPDVTFVNGGEKKLFAYTRVEYPARVRRTIVLSTADMTGRWSYRGSLRVPRSLQVIAGMPIHTTRMRLTIGGGPYAKNYITTTHCPNGGWRYRATAHYRYDATGRTARDTVTGTIPCTS
jgi:hypothetical protein